MRLFLWSDPVGRLVLFLFFAFDAVLFMMAVKFHSDDDLDIRDSMIILALSCMLTVGVTAMLSGILGVFAILPGLAIGAVALGVGLSLLLGMPLKGAVKIGTIFGSLHLVFALVYPYVVVAMSQ